MKRLFILVLSFTAVSCTANYTKVVVEDTLADAGLRDTHAYQRNAKWTIPRSKLIALQTIDPARHPVMPRASFYANEAILDAFSTHYPYVREIPNSLSTAIALNSAREQNFDPLYTRPVSASRKQTEYVVRAQRRLTSTSR